MSFWSSFSSASKLATSALKEAQKKLDKVLDIDEDAPPSDGTGVLITQSSFIIKYLSR